MLRSALLGACAAIVVLAASAATASAALEPLLTVDNMAYGNPTAVTGHTTGVCDANGEGDFSYTYGGTTHVVGDPAGTFTETGTFSVRRVDGVQRITAIEGTWVADSSRAHVEGRRHGLRTGGRNTVRCGGTSEATRFVDMFVETYYETTRYEMKTDDRTGEDWGWGWVNLSEWGKDAANNPYRPNGGGGSHNSFSSDKDWDGRRPFQDNCLFVYNPDQADSDGDGTGDACDGPVVVVPLPVDTDGDGVDDDADNCDTTPNPGQANTGGDARGDACEDRDLDGAYDAVDNCVDDAGSQLDSDGDGRGDVCDPDDDGDGVADGDDNCPAVPNAPQRDSDLDGAGDACDGTFDSSDGHATGGGFVLSGGRKVHLSFSARSVAGVLEGTGRVADGGTTVRLLDVTGLRQDDAAGRAVIVGTALVGGARVPYRLEVVDGGEPSAADTVELEAGDYHLAGTLAGGNLQVR